MSEIERLEARCQFMPDQFFRGLASEINPNKVDILIPELKSLMDKIFLMLDNVQNPSEVREIEDLARYLLRVYQGRGFITYKEQIVRNIVILYRKYLVFYSSVNCHRFKGGIDSSRTVLANPSPNDRVSLQIMNKWVFSLQHITL